MPSYYEYELATGSLLSSPFGQAVVTSLFGLMLTTEEGPDSEGIYASIPEGDLLLVNGALVWGDGIEYARQVVEARSSFFLGEYFVDTRLGVPYYRDVLIKDPQREVILSIFQRVALSVPGIVDVIDMTYEFDERARTADVSYEAVWADGQTIPVSFPLILG